MSNIIENVIECDTAYGMVCVLACLFFFNAVIRFVVAWLYKYLCKFCNTIVKYKDVHTKANVKDVSFEMELHR